MTFYNNFNPKRTSCLFGEKNQFLLLKNLLINNKFPQTLMLSGEKGLGKLTTINHLMHYYFDKDNYDDINFSFKKDTPFFHQNLNNLYPNLIYLEGLAFKNIKTDDIRKLKILLLKKPINNNKRFIILDDVELFNLNSLNALLKIIEEPGDANFFVLINNKSNPIIETIKSRCLELKFILDNDEKNKIQFSLMKYFEQNSNIDMNIVHVSPGNFLRINHFFNEQKININEDIVINFNKILNLYRKEKDIFYKDLLLFVSEYYLLKNKSKNFINKSYIFETRSFLVKNINDFFLYNLSQNSLLHSIESKFQK